MHDLDDTVVAVFDDGPHLDQIAADLSAAGYEFEMIRGEEGKKHLDPAGERGAAATLKRLVTAFGDQYRVLDHLYAELDAGRVVVSVDATPDAATDAVRVLSDRGGDFIWKLGSWTFTQVSGE